MAELPRIAIFADQPGQADYLADIVRLAGCIPTNEGAVASFKMTEAGLSVVRKDGVERVFKTPVRAGEIASQIRKFITNAGSQEQPLSIGDGILDVRDSLWLREGDSPLRLTEKEVAILLALKQANGKAVPRQALLDQVWAYAQGVETHTLETHIYRLRQKIEIDPSSPKIILTQEDGYILGV